MDAVDVQLILGRASLTARRLRGALGRLGIPACGVAAAEALIGEPASALLKLGLPPAASAWLSAPNARRIAADRRWLDHDRIVLIDVLGSSYPPLLAAISDAPALLYVRGQPRALAEPQLAIVGTRTPTLPGRRTARQFAAALARASLTITSGLAFGIDAASHGASLASGGRTVAVLGSGLDQVYPPRHELLAERIAAQGALVSELPPGAAPVRWAFPRRNRLISGLSLATLVIEAADDSGSLITAQQAIKQGRPVFAIPGSIHSPEARGCHRLIRDGARLVENADDILREIPGFVAKPYDMAPVSGSDRLTATAIELDKGQKILLDALGSEPASIDVLVGRTGFPSQTIASMLLILELQGAIGAEPGGRFVRLFDERHG